MLDATIVLVGCGGTGGFLDEPRSSWSTPIPSSNGTCRVRPSTVLTWPVKVEVLAQRLSRRFGGEIGYSVLRYDPRIYAEVFGQSTRLGLVIGAVGNARARCAIGGSASQRTGYTRWAGGPSPILWLDSGNGRDSGQVLLGRAATIAQLRHSFHKHTSVCTGLPAPGLQRPDLLSAPPGLALAQTPSCAQQVADGEQSRTVNQRMAGAAAGMATYLDLTDGSLRCVPAQPRAVPAGISGCERDCDFYVVTPA